MSGHNCTGSSPQLQWASIGHALVITLLQVLLRTALTMTGETLDFDLQVHMVPRLHLS
jgi:hypothetical protein